MVFVCDWSHKSLQVSENGVVVGVSSDQRMQKDFIFRGKK